MLHVERFPIVALLVVEEEQGGVEEEARNKQKKITCRGLREVYRRFGQIDC